MLALNHPVNLMLPGSPFSLAEVCTLGLPGASRVCTAFVLQGGEWGYPISNFRLFNSPSGIVLLLFVISLLCLLGGTTTLAALN